MAEFCRNHPTAEASAPCARCAQPFCDACLVDIMGQRFCGPCRDVRLREMQGQIPGQVSGEARLAGTGTVDLGRWLSEGWQIISGDIMAFALATLLTLILSGVSCGILMGPMFCGLYMMCYRKMLNGRVDASNVFDGFRRAGPAILAWLLAVVIGVGVLLVLALPFGLLAMAREGLPVEVGARLMLGTMGTVVYSLVVGGTFFVLPHIAARNVDVGTALADSWAVVRRNPLMFILTAFVMHVISELGSSLCCIGSLVAMPWMVAVQARAYADHFGITGFDER